MEILFVTSAHNSLSQRFLIDLKERAMRSMSGRHRGRDHQRGFSKAAPDLIIASMLKIAVPEEVFSRCLCLIVHPGTKGDRGPSSLDWAITNAEQSWDVSILEAAIG